MFYYYYYYYYLTCMCHLNWANPWYLSATKVISCHILVHSEIFTMCMIYGSGTDPMLTLTNHLTSSVFTQILYHSSTENTETTIVLP